MAGGIAIELGWPAPELSPNARVHPLVRHRFAKAAKVEARWVTMIARPLRYAPPEGDIPLKIVAHPPKNWRTGDRDNLVARLKSHIDGIAKALGINDRRFESPTVEWGDKCERGKVIIIVGSGQ